VGVGALFGARLARSNSFCQNSELCVGVGMYI
jgi:hypothetical protein